ncbi:glycosyltransferase family 2 protein [Natrinema versiforme]|uniref:Glycosyl transferase family 2 n=1 Tax=Natrinema versiforme JCM 10478 TaxID=1227496 RepID=L9XP30_9EURY|nr:glycosyltransferase family 2 protein [Natrinema versiforme]ELY63495.1 glycosyl transferase family 2 [Natrinema versiforme JCM 10478]
MTAFDPHDRAGPADALPATPDRPVEELVVTPADDVSPTLSIVLPTKNEAAGIGECLDRIERAIATLGVPTEIIVSDSSTDRTPEIARAHGATVVMPDRPGYGAAYQRAFEAARGEFIVIGDADTTYDFAAIPRLVEHLVATDADLVLGSRLAGEIEPGAMPWLHRYVGNPLLTRFLNTFYGTEVSDAHSGFRVVTRAALETLELTTDGMEFASEMIMEAGARGLTIEEVPITYHEREGEATLESFRDGWRHVRFMLTNAPGYLFSVPGLGLGVLGLVLMGLVAAGTPVGGVTLGVRSMIAGGVLVLVGYQIMSFAVFSTVATDPIQRPSDPLTRWLNRALTIRRGGVGGCVVFAGGSLYALALLYRWLTAGYATLPVVTSDIAALVAIAFGVQTVFTSFLAAMLRESRLARTRANARSAAGTDGHDPAAGD